MSKPIQDVAITTVDEKTGQVRAVFDSGSFYTIVREDKLPSHATLEKRKTPLEFRTAAQGGMLRVTAEVHMVIRIGEKMIEDSARVSPDLAQDMLIGAKTMQAWDISIVNKNGHTEVIVGHDMRDPDITEVD